MGHTFSDLNYSSNNDANSSRKYDSLSWLFRTASEQSSKFEPNEPVSYTPSRISTETTFIRSATDEWEGSSSQSEGEFPSLFAEGSFLTHGPLPDEAPLQWSRKPWREVQQMQYTQGVIRQEVVAIKSREALARSRQETDYFTELPTEMMYSILAHLNITEVARLGLVCKYLRQLLFESEADNALWFKLYDNHFGMDYEQDKSQDFVESKPVVWRQACIEQAQSIAWRKANETDLLRWASEQGHWKLLARARLKETNTINAADIDRIMVAAAGEGHKICVDILSDALIYAGCGLDGVAYMPEKQQQTPARVRNSVYSRRGYTAMLKAALRGHADVVALLLAKGADVNAKDSWGETSCLKAARGGFTKIVKMLTDHNCDIHAKNTDGEDALLAAAKTGQLKCIEILLQHGAILTTTHTAYRNLLRAPRETGQK